MAGLLIPTRAILLCLVHLLLAHLVHCQCNTNQNPYCSGNSKFEQICCTYPNVCYWSDRSGTPACCPAGTDCSSDGGPSGGFALSNVQQTTVQTTYLVQTVYTTTQPQEETVTYYTSSQWQTWQEQTTTTYAPAPVYTSWSTIATSNVVVVTATTPVVEPAQTNGVYVTVEAVGNRASSPKIDDACSVRAFGAFVLVCGLVWSI